MDQAEFDADNLSADQKRRLELSKDRQRWGYERPVRGLFDQDRQKSHTSKKGAEPSPYGGDDEEEET